MPNHVDNELMITGSHTELQKFKEFAVDENEKLSANKFIPYPKKFKELDEKAKNNPKMKDGYNSGGYEWCIKHWGTKWDFYQVELLNESKNRLHYVFYTAWSPAVPVIKKMAKKFLKLVFVLRYYEGGMGFQGRMEFKDGKIIFQNECDYHGHRGG